jgi:hypothetical protein
MVESGQTTRVTLHKTYAAYASSSYAPKWTGVEPTDYIVTMVTVVHVFTIMYFYTLVVPDISCSADSNNNNNNNNNINNRLIQLNYEEKQKSRKSQVKM